MASPVVTFADKMQRLAAFWDRMEKGGLTFEDLQSPIDDPGMRTRLIRNWQAGAPDLRAVPTILIPFDEPDCHREAREIMGDNFHGIAAVQRHFGAYTEQELGARRDIPFSEQTLRECAKEFILLPTHPLDLPGIHRAHPERFNDDPDAPWFGEQKQREKWSSQTIADPWLLVRKNVVPDSWNKRIDAQKKHIERFPKERLVLPAEFAYAALVRYLETREKLCGEYIVRFAVQTAEGNWVNVNWNGDQLNFNNWNDNANDNIASGSVRHFLLSIVFTLSLSLKQWPIPLRRAAAVCFLLHRLHPATEHTADFIDCLLDLGVLSHANAYRLSRELQNRYWFSRER